MKDTSGGPGWLGRRRLGAAAVAALVCALGLAAPAWAAPSITISPTSARAGDEVTITGSGWTGAAGHFVPCFWASEGRDSGWIGILPVKPDGTFSVKVKIPSDTTPGRHAVQCTFDDEPVETAFFTLTVPPDYQLTSVAPLPGDATSGATDVNDAGQATVKSKTSSPASDNGAVWSGGELNPIGTGGVFPNAINDSAVVAGSNKPSAFDFDAFSCLFRAGACSGGLFDLGGLGGTDSFGNDVNAGGLIVGGSELPGDSASHAFACNNRNCTGGMHDLGTLGGTSSLAEGVNDSRDVVGQAATAGGALHAFLCEYRPGPGTCAGGMDDLGTLGGTASTAHEVSSTGAVVGDSQVTGNTARHAFLYDGSMHDLKTLPGATNSFAHGVNGDGTVVGNTSSGHSFIWSTRIFQLDRYVRPRDWTIFDAASINEHGQIAATGFESGGADRALILSPTGLVRPVKIADSGFDPATVTVRQGGVVQWVNNGPGTHSVADTSGLSLYSSGNLPSGVGFPFVFETAGRYRFQDIPRGLIGEVRVPVDVAPEVGDLSTTFQLVLAADEEPPNGVFDIRVKVPGATNYADYREGVGAPGTTFTPEDGPGQYRFSARLRNHSTDLASGWSPPATITVGP